MPLVSNFVKRFKFFITFLNEGNETFKQIKFKEDCGEFIRNVENHLSFDTFFKKLFHQNEGALIIKYKKILYLYFIFEHLIELPYDINKFREYEKLSNLDLRYDALIAGLLKPKQASSFFAKVNFITWNYDLNLFNSLRNFFKPNEQFRSIFNNNLYQGNSKSFSFNDECLLMHLNGILFHPFINGIVTIPVQDLRNKFNSEFVEQFYNQEDSISQMSKHINFAWESIENPVFNYANDAIIKSKNIVIIGYSFPLYNRLIDQTFLNHVTLKNKSIFIQDLDNSILETFKDIFSITSINRNGIGNSTMKLIQNCKSFFVPKDVFKI